MIKSTIKIMKCLQKVSKVVTPAKAGVHKQLMLLDSRFHGNDNNGCFLTFYEFINPWTLNLERDCRLMFKHMSLEKQFQIFRKNIWLNRDYMEFCRGTRKVWHFRECKKTLFRHYFLIEPFSHLFSLKSLLLTFSLILLNNSAKTPRNLNNTPLMIEGISSSIEVLTIEWKGEN